MISKDGSSTQDGEPLDANAIASYPDRTTWKTMDTIEHIWAGLGMPSSALQSVKLPDVDQLGLPSSFKIGHVAQASIALSALSAGLIGSMRNDSAVAEINVPLRSACADFTSSALYLLDGKRIKAPRPPVGGLHPTADGYVRIHDSFPNHRDGALKLLGLDPEASTKSDVSEKTRQWSALDLERRAVDNKVVIAALRSYREWDALPHARAISNFPILIAKHSDSTSDLHSRILSPSRQCLKGVRVVELSRVIAAPLAGKTLAAHGADVLWVTSPNLPDLPALDIEYSRGKRSIQLDLSSPKDQGQLLELIKSADVFIQSYRPSSLQTKGLGVHDLVATNPKLIYASMSAYGSSGPWSERRGFDSMIQTCSGMNVSEAEHAGKGEPARMTPTQALDHAGGYFLATGIMCALYKTAVDGGAYTVDVSLAGVMRYLRSLGQYDGDSGFQCEDITSPDQIPELLDTNTTAFGDLTTVRHAANIEGYSINEGVPRPLGSDKARWLDAA